MAYVWIGSVRHTRMNKIVDYAVNPVITAYDSKASEEVSMTANIAYTLDSEKGTIRLLQTAVNLDGIETTWEEMKDAKDRWSKTGGVQGFHVVQPFAPGEATPELAHRIGVEFVERCFPDFQAVVGTHLDKAHIHNPIVLNSVSYVDGTSITAPRRVIILTICLLTSIFYLYICRCGDSEQHQRLR